MTKEGKVGKTVFIVMPKEAWPRDLTKVRVFDNREAARANASDGRTYTEISVHKFNICLHCGAEKGENA